MHVFLAPLLEDKMKGVSQETMELEQQLALIEPKCHFYNQIAKLCLLSSPIGKRWDSCNTWQEFH